MMDKLKIPARIQVCIIDNLEPGKEGRYPDWSAASAGKVQIHIQAPEGENSGTNGKTQGSGGTLVPERAPNENND